MKKHFIRTFLLLPPVFFMARLNERVFRPLVEGSADGIWRPIASTFMDAVSALFVLSFLALCLATVFNFIVAVEDARENNNGKE